MRSERYFHPEFGWLAPTSPAANDLPPHRTCFAMPVGSSSPTMATTRGPCSTTSGTRTFSIRSGTPTWRPTASRTFGGSDDDGGRQVLAAHLPPYLVQIRKIYSIFSLGIHELDNHTCLQFFDVGKRSIIVILEDDLKKQEELIARKELADAIAKFSPKQGQQET
jgi:hypothetical protein